MNRISRNLHSTSPSSTLSVLTVVLESGGIQSHAIKIDHLFMKRWSITPLSVPVRIAFITILVSGCLLYWHWKAGIISNLSVQKFNPPFMDLPGLLLTSYKVSVLKGTSYQNLFDDPQGKSPLFNQVWKEKMEPNKDLSLLSNKQEGVDQMIRNPDVTHFDTIQAMKTFPEFKTCQIMDIPTDLYTSR